MHIHNSPQETRNPDSEELWKLKGQSNEGSSAKSKIKKTYPEAANALGALRVVKNEFLTTEAGETDAMILGQNGLKPQQLIADMLNEDEDNNLNEFEDGRKSRLEFQKLQVIDIATGIISMLGVALTVIAVNFFDLEISSSMILNSRRGMKTDCCIFYGYKLQQLLSQVSLLLSSLII